MFDQWHRPWISSLVVSLRSGQAVASLEIRVIKSAVSLQIPRSEVFRRNGHHCQKAGHTVASQNIAILCGQVKAAGLSQACEILKGYRLLPLRPSSLSHRR